VIVALIGCVPTETMRTGSRVAAPTNATTHGPSATTRQATSPAIRASTPQLATSAAARRVPAGESKTPRLALGSQGAVSSAEAHASDVGIAILKRGGNAVDAAIAVAFALAVTHPSAGNLGGGGFMLVHMVSGQQSAIDYREMAPGRATRDMYLDANGSPTRASLVGAKAAGIPGTVAGMGLAHKRFAVLPWKTLLEPAIDLAARGHTLDRFHADDLRHGAMRMQAAGLHASARHYLRADGKTHEVGDRWIQADLAATLRAIRDRGASAFYSGPLAAQMAHEVQRAGGIWTVADLANYRAKARKPIAFDYRGHQIISMPPPSAGGVVLRHILGASELLKLERLPWQSGKAVHLYVEASRRAYADRNVLLADPDFVALPLQTLLSQSYLRRRMSTIDAARATPSSKIRAGLPAPHAKQPARKASEETTHFSVIDGAGNAVSNTYTLNTGFGSKFVIPGVAVLLNNEMDDFSVKPGHANTYGLVQNEQNRIQPAKRMLSSMTPTIVLQNGEVRAILGSPGGPTITTTVAQLSMALIDHGQTLDSAVAAGRIHHQWLPDRVFLERRLPAALKRSLEARGHAVTLRGDIGHANCIEVDPETRGFRAVADTDRDGGKAAAY
jgi:gamma-glutamyltranspeptidase/glutathione hydrolase